MLGFCAAFLKDVAIEMARIVGLFVSSQSAI